MPHDPLNPLPGELVFNGTEFKPYAVDLPPGGCLGMVPTREGFPAVVQELLANHPAQSGLAGISDQEIAALILANERIARIDVFLPALMKAVEMLTETRYML